MTTTVPTYTPLTWSESFDDNDNSQYEAASTVYSATGDGDSFYYRVRSIHRDNNIFWHVDHSDKELVPDGEQPAFKTIDDARFWCEEQNEAAFKAEHSVEPKVIRFFIDDDSGEPWQLVGDVIGIHVVVKVISDCHIIEALKKLIDGKDGDQVTLTIKRQDMTAAEVEALPDL